MNNKRIRIQRQTLNRGKSKTTTIYDGDDAGAGFAVVGTAICTALGDGDHAGPQRFVIDYAPAGEALPALLLSDGAKKRAA